MAAVNLHARDWSRVSVKWTTDLKRFVFSPHCRDLLALAVAAIGVAVAFFFVHGWLQYQLDSTLIAAILAAVFGVCAWTFQSANLRFGAADIFASEIVTLCRISAVVDFIPHLCSSYKPNGQRMRPSQSTQDYVVIFHNNSKDLEILDGVVVTWVTEFYVYFKAMLETLSRVPASDQDSGYKDALLNVIYMAFLTYESGRQALMRLIDDKPDRREAILTTLLSEIPAYNLLSRAFDSRPSDIRKHRIDGRLAHYKQLMIAVEALATAPPSSDPQAIKIRDLAREVLARWKDGKAERADPSRPPQPPIVASQAA